MSDRWQDEWEIMLIIEWTDRHVLASMCGSEAALHQMAPDPEDQLKWWRMDAAVR